MCIRDRCSSQQHRGILHSAWATWLGGLNELESDDDLTPTKVMKYWEQRKALEVKPQKLPTQETYYDKLKDDDEKMEALNDAYYRELKGSVGARAFSFSKSAGLCRESFYTTPTNLQP